MTLIWINFLYLILVLTMLPYYLPLLLSGERGSILLEMVLLFFSMLILKMRYRSHPFKMYGSVGFKYIYNILQPSPLANS